MESVFGTDVPHLTDSKIESYVSSEDWMIIPVKGEENKEQARQSQRPNLFFGLSYENSIQVGITYDKIESVQRLRQILLPFNNKVRTQLLGELLKLDSNYMINVSKKIKEYYWAQSPLYEAVYEHQCNALSPPNFVDMFASVDRILAERELLEKGKKYKLAPSINLVEVFIQRDEAQFLDTLRKIKPIYEIAVSVETEQEFEADKAEIDANRRQEFGNYVQELQKKLKAKEISPEQYRELTMKFWKK